MSRSSRPSQHGVNPANALAVPLDSLFAFQLERIALGLAAGDYLAWLDPRVGRAAALVRCESPLSDLLSSRPVDARVNDVRFDDPACVEPSPQLAWF